MTGPEDAPEPATGPLEPPPAPAPAIAPSAGGLAPAPPPTMPGTVAIIGRGLDLNVAASAEIRRGSVYVGLLGLLAGGPIAAVLWAFSVRQGGFDWLAGIVQGARPRIVPVESVTGLLMFVVFSLGLGCLVALSFDAQLLAVTVIGGRATGRRFDLRGALGLARLRFWRLVRASFLVGLVLAIPRFAVDQLVTAGRPAGTEADVLVLTAINVLLSTPFAYVAAGIVLGAVGGWESIRRSWVLARARWRLAFLIAIVNTAVSYLAGFAIGTGADVLARLGAVFGLGGPMGTEQVAALAAIIVLAIVSVGSLTMTIAALTVAPQVVAFLGLTGYSAGLDALREPAESTAPPPATPLVSTPMAVALIVAWGAAIVAVRRLL